MRRFKLVRHEDISGVSGTGDVAEGIEFTDGSVAIRWHGPHPSTAAWPSIDDAIAIHGHSGSTEFVWIDVDPADRSACAYPHLDHSDGRGCETDDCPRHGGGA